MGRRSSNSTKSGKFMNPTDQARKEARRKELKKNKRQRTMVRAAVLKGKDPVRIIEELEQIDNIEFNTATAPILNEKVLREKRRKLNETYQRVISMYVKDQPETAQELRQTIIEYENRRFKMQVLYEQAKSAERVQLSDIPLPDMPQGLPLPGEIPLPSVEAVPGILKRRVAKRAKRMKLKPQGPPPGTPPSLSGGEDAERPERSTRRIRFAEDNNATEAGGDILAEEKDTRLKFKPNVSSLQVKMLRIAGQKIPMSVTGGAGVAGAATATSIPVAPASVTPAAASITPAIVSAAPTLAAVITAPPVTNPIDEDTPSIKESQMVTSHEVLDDDSGDSDDDEVPIIHTNLSSIMMPPGPPPGAPPMIPLPYGLPPGPPPTLMMPPPPPRMLLPNFMPRPPPQYSVHQMTAPNDRHAPFFNKKVPSSGPTITAKPQLLTSGGGDITKFMPTSLRVKRIIRDSHGRQIKPSPAIDPMYMEVKKPVISMKTKDDAYENFMKEMQNFM